LREDVALLELTLQQANELIRLTLENARARNMPPIAVAVLDQGAHLISLQREDGVTFMRIQIAQAKAWGALGMGVNSEQIAARYLKNEQQKGFIDALNSMTGGQLIPLAGGVLIRNQQGEVIGAIGAAGGESVDDESCVFAAIDALGLKR
jgi:uncharacterized protein GlcG (DUF336 family)